MHAAAGLAAAALVGACAEDLPTVDVAIDVIEVIDVVEGKDEGSRAVEAAGQVVIGDAAGAHLEGRTRSFDLGGELLDAASFADTAVILSAGGLFFVDGEEILPSPLLSSLPAVPAFIEACGERLILGSDGALFSYAIAGEAATLAELDVGVRGFTTASCTGDVLLAVAPPRLVEIELGTELGTELGIEAGSGVRAARDLGIEGVSSAAFARTQVLFRARDTVARVDEPGRALTAGALGLFGAGGVAWAPTSAGLLVSDEAGALATTRPAMPAPAWLFPLPEGKALIVDDRGQVGRVERGRAVFIEGVRANSLLEAPVTVEVKASHDATVSVTLDGAPAEATFSLNPALLAVGAHTITAEARFDDGAVARREVVFFAGAFDVPTWNEHIRPLYESVCSRCHSVQGGAHLLDTSDRWRAEIDRIVSALDNRLMPPDEPLGSEDVSRVRLWRATGMEE